MTDKLREFTAVVWKKDSQEPGVHETLMARNREEARAMIETKHGKDILVSLKDVEAADRPR